MHTKFGQLNLILRKIIKMVPPDVIFEANMHQIRFRLGAPPQTPLWELTALSQRGPTSNGKGRDGSTGKGREEEDGRVNWAEGVGEEGNGKRDEG